MISRRSFIAGTGGTAVAVGVIAVAPGCSGGKNEQTLTAPLTANPFFERPAADVPLPPEAPPSQVLGLQFFSPEQARTADALYARIMPGDAQDPGAREAGVLYYVDYALSQGEGWNEPIYKKGPFAQPYTGAVPPGPDTDAVIYVQQDQLRRYGPQSSLTPREVYARGLAQLDQYAQSKHGATFADLSEAQQDGIIDELANGKIASFTAPTDVSFFSAVRDDVVGGMFADPAYGGNRDLAGWKLVGYPGAQRGYTEADMKKDGTVNRPPQSLADLHHYEPGPADQPNAIYPVRGAQSHH